MSVSSFFNRCASSQMRRSQAVGEANRSCTRSEYGPSRRYAQCTHRVQAEGLVRNDEHLYESRQPHVNCAARRTERRTWVWLRGDRNCVTLAMTSARADSASGVVRTRPLSHFSHSESLQV